MRGLQPRLQPTTLILSDGSTVKFGSPLFTTGLIKLNDDIKNQAPWAPDSGSIVDTSGQLAKFQQREEQATTFDAASLYDDDDDDDDDW